jgi:zinc protease
VIHLGASVGVAIGLLSACAMVGGRGSTSAFLSSQTSGEGYQLKPFEEKTLENGLRLLYVPDEALPYVSFSMVLRSGSAMDPANQAGLSAFVAEMLDKGTRSRKAPKIADDLGKLGAEFDATAALDYSHVTMTGLSKNGDALATNLIELVTQPAFSDDEIERTRKNILAQLERRMDRPDSFASMAWEKDLYGTHPYGTPILGYIKTVKELRKKNLIQYYLHNYRPNNAILAVVGKFTPELKAKIEKEFGTWQKRDISTASFEAPKPLQGLELQVVDKPGIAQAQIRMGHLGIRRANEDFLALRVANTILGGAFASRLNSKIRIELGLTYSISSHFDARQFVGPFEISTFTKNETVGQTIAETLKLVSEFKNKGVTREELERAKGYLKGIFPTAIETPEKLALNLQLLRLYGIPDQYLTHYLHDIDKLSLSDVNRVIHTYFDDKNIKAVVFTSAKEVVPQLEKLGKVEVIKAADLQ